MSYDDGYEKISAARAIYSKIPPLYCPLLEDTVYFTRHGFNHLIWKGRIPRSKSQQEERLALIPSIPTIIGDAKADVTFNDSRVIRFWTLTSKINDTRVRVVLDQPSGRKIFVSIYPIKNKKSHEM